MRDVGGMGMRGKEPVWGTLDVGVGDKGCYV